MKLSSPKNHLPSWQNALLAFLSAILLILSFPDFEFWFLAWFALVPLMWAVEREQASAFRSFILGWIFGTVFFFGVCWWLTFAPVTYAGFPVLLAYFLLFCVTAVTGLFPAIFAALFALAARKWGRWSLAAVPFFWGFTEFVRYWVTGNNWNALGYSQAFRPVLIGLASVGGVLLVGAMVAGANSLILLGIHTVKPRFVLVAAVAVFLSIPAFWPASVDPQLFLIDHDPAAVRVLAIQPNVPMSGLDQEKLMQLRQRQAGMAEQALSKSDKHLEHDRPATLVILPESPMNFMYADDREFQKFMGDFARRNNVNVLFNSAEPDQTNGKFYNSAVMVSAEGTEAAQYDKIYLVPFGEAVPFFLEGILPGFVGNFSYGREYDLLALGDVRAGVMICFESHFGALSREYVRNGADALIEMTNDGYLGPTPVLRQHLANAVFRAVETKRPVLRATNVGITAYINQLGEVFDPAAPYTEDTRVFTVWKSDGKQTFYVRYGEWFAWLCSFVTMALLGHAFFRRQQHEV